MKSFILLAFCCLSIPLASAHPAVPCHGPTYFDCYQYCQIGCHGPNCMHSCQAGCGCEEAFIVRNNGACWKVAVCEVSDDDKDAQDAQGGKHKHNPLKLEAGHHKKKRNRLMRYLYNFDDFFDGFYDSFDDDDVREIDSNFVEKSSEESSDYYY